MAVQIKCAKYTGDPRVIDKQPTLVETLECRITDPCDMYEPTVMLTRTDNTKACNYFVIGFRKYFKVKEINSSNNIVTLKLHEDVLSTWMPKVHVKGIINRASETVSMNADQDFFLDECSHVSRIAFTNNYIDLTGQPLIVVQSTAGLTREPTS